MQFKEGDRRGRSEVGGNMKAKQRELRMGGGRYKE